MPSTSLLDFDWEQTYASLTSALAERLLTQEDCMVCRAEGATVAPQGITAWTTWCGERWRRQTSRRCRSRQACLELMRSGLTVSRCCRENKESASRGTSQ